MPDYANSLVENHNENTRFFYASPMGSLRADGVLHQTSEIEEAYTWLDFYSRKDTKPSIIAGAIPFHAKNKAGLILPKQTFLAGSTSPTQQPLRAVAMGAQVISQYPTPEKFMDNIAQALMVLKSQSLRKVVLSRMIKITTENDIDIKKLLLNLLTTNRLARTFFWANSHEHQDSILIGSSPEVIISKQGLNIRTNPLAGSIARSANPIEDYLRGRALLNSQKDLHEHALMIGAIETILRRFCSTVQIPQHPSLISTPTMWHLSTQIKGTLSDPKIDSLSIARALHPTPAVCGHPTELALQSIQNLEGYERELYAGLIGWMNHKGDGEWALTIRCAKIFERSLTLYAGAGIVEGSEPHKELAETLAKFGTLSNALGFALQQ